MIFVTVGTLFPFDRLVKGVDEAVNNLCINERIFAQIGKTEYKPKNMEYVDFLDKDKFAQIVNHADYLISHAGIGSIVLALEKRKPLLVMPRMKEYREHVNNHQTATAKKFEELGHILAVYDVKDLPVSINKLKEFVPKERKANPEAVANRISQFLNNL